MHRERRIELMTGLLAGVAGLAALAGALYGLFGPLVTRYAGTPDEQSVSHFEDGLGTGGWLLFLGYFLGGVATFLAGSLLAADVFRPKATVLLVLSATGLAVLAGFTVLGVGWLVLPGAILGLIAMMLSVFADSDG